MDLNSQKLLITQCSGPFLNFTFQLTWALAELYLSMRCPG
jgi:hypothetical protein